MSVLVKPFEQFEFKGVYTAGNPVQRPRNTAQVCENFRIMPGNWLRLRGGRLGRYIVPSSGIVQQLYALQGIASGSDHQLAQVKFGSAVKWHKFTLLSYIINEGVGVGSTEAESISTAYDGGFALTHPAAACNLTDRPLLYNGLGVREVVSTPPFSTAHDGGVRYFGLDAYTPSGSPSVEFNAGDGENQIQDYISVYVGLYHSATDHYSNGVYAGRVESSDEDTGTITVSGLSTLTYATHGASETAELFYVFYATIDAGQVPYLVLNSSLDGPHKVPVGSASASLSIEAGTTNGWTLDLTKEMPTENFPPRPMRCVAYVAGRIYGALMFGGAGGNTEFSYTPEARDMSAVVWSAAASDTLEKDLLGDPLQCWPLLNISYTPSGDQPIAITGAVDQQRVLVITSTSTFYLSEQADGIHEFITISRIHGITNPATLRVTDYGHVWVDQRNQIVILRPGRIEVEVLSGPYQSLMVGTPTCADYLLAPLHLIDRYQVWLSTGISVVHDFAVGGQGYSFTSHDFTAAATGIDRLGRTHHVVAKNSIYTHEAQPEDNVIPALDYDYVAGVLTVREFDGTWARNWDDFGDSDVRKELPILDLMGDGDMAAALGVTPMSVEWYADLEEVSVANKKTVAGQEILQGPTTSVYRFKLASAHKFWYKLVFKLRGHSADAPVGAGWVLTAPATHFPDIATEGNLAKNFYGSIVRALWRLGVSENRA